MMAQSHEIAESSTSSSCCKKQKVFEIEKEDRITSLPEPLLAHILSFLPTKDAAKTVLLRTFGNLWKFSPNLDFHVTLYNNRSIMSSTQSMDRWFVNFIDHIILLHESPTINKFCLTFGSAIERKRFMSWHLVPSLCNVAQRVDSWICFALRKRVNILQVEISKHGLYGGVLNYNLPDSVFNSDSLTELKLVSCGFKHLGKIHMRSLKSLSLERIILCNSLIEEILSGCLSLESLSLIRCCGIHKLNITSECLKSLTITLGEDETSCLEIYCPNVKSLNIFGAIWRVSLKDSSSLVCAHLDFYCGGRYSNQEYQQVGWLLEELSHTKFLTICNWCTLVLAIWESSPSLNRKFLVLKTMQTKWHLLGIANLLRNSSTLERLTIYIEPGALVLTSDDVMWLQAFGFHQKIVGMMRCGSDHTILMEKITGIYSSRSIVLQTISKVLEYMAV